jgi:uncharacterized protein (DUF488 family)
VRRRRGARACDETSVSDGFTLLTLGHGTASEDELAELIRNASVESVIDVRAIPKSGRHPQFRRERLERWIPELTGSAYLWQPALGGFRKPAAGSANVALRHPSFRAFADYMETEVFAAALRALVARARNGQAAILCSETLWWRCHRRLISDSARLQHRCATMCFSNGRTSRLEPACRALRDFGHFERA